MSPEPLEASLEPISPAEEAIVTLLERKWPDYYPELDTHDATIDKQARVSNVLRQVKPFAVIEGAPEAANPSALCSELIEKLRTEVFEPFNPKVGAAIAGSMQDALAILAPGAEHKYSDETRKYQAFANYYLLLAAISSEFGGTTPIESATTYRVTPYPADLRANETHAFTDGSQLNTYHMQIKGDFGAKELRDYDENGQLINRDFLQQPATLLVHSRLGVRVGFSLSQDTSNKHHVSQEVEWRRKGTTQAFSDFSIRLDKDNTYGTGFSLDVGRDARDNATMHRPGDVVGEALQAARPEHGSHFPEHFEGVTDADFDEFIGNLNKFLRADAEMARLDTRLRNRDSLNIDARWENANWWPVPYDSVMPLTRGASGLRPFGPFPKSDQK